MTVFAFAALLISCLYFFPVAVVTNDQKGNGLKQHKLIVLYFCSPEI